jgi:hypothetical protein
MRRLAAQRCFRAFDIGDADWRGVDIPEALAHAEHVFEIPDCNLYPHRGLGVRR